MHNNSYLEIDQKMTGDIYTSPEVMDNLTVLCDDFGSRFGGTAGEKQAVEFMQAKLTGDHQPYPEGNSLHHATPLTTSGYGSIDL